MNSIFKKIIAISLCFVSLSAFADITKIKSFKLHTKIVKPAKEQNVAATITVKGYSAEFYAYFYSSVGGETITLRGKPFTADKKVSQKLYSDEISLIAPNGTYTLNSLQYCELQGTCYSYSANELVLEGILSEVPSFEVVTPAQLQDTLQLDVASITQETGIVDVANKYPALALNVLISDDAETIDSLSIEVCKQPDFSACYTVQHDDIPANQLVDIDLYRQYDWQPDWELGTWSISWISARSKSDNVSLYDTGSYINGVSNHEINLTTVLTNGLTFDVINSKNVQE